MVDINNKKVIKINNMKVKSTHIESTCLFTIKRIASIPVEKIDDTKTVYGFKKEAVRKHNILDKNDVPSTSDVFQ